MGENLKDVILNYVRAVARDLASDQNDTYIEDLLFDAALALSVEDPGFLERARTARTEGVNLAAADCGEDPEDFGPVADLRLPD